MPKTNKPETKTERRRLRGIEVAQAALLLVIGVVIALVLYFITVGMVASTPAPNVQVDAYNSFLAGDTAKVVLKFGKSVRVSNVVILGNDGSQITNDCEFPPGASKPMAVNAGQEYIFTCKLATGKSWQTNMMVNVTLADGSFVFARWVTG